MSSDYTMELIKLYIVIFFMSKYSNKLTENDRNFLLTLKIFDLANLNLTSLLTLHIVNFCFTLLEY